MLQDMSDARSRTVIEPRRELLDALARRYHHLQVEHQKFEPGNSVRRRLEDELLDVRTRFERALDEWLPGDEELRGRWHAYLEHHAPLPDAPPTLHPVVFRGRSAVSGSVVEIRGEEDDLEVWVDGSLVERIAGEKDFRQPIVTFRLNGNEFEEEFRASPESIQALAGFVQGGGSPPWEYGYELLEDGLVDVHWGVTPRGRRALAR